MHFIVFTLYFYRLIKIYIWELRRHVREPVAFCREPVPGGGRVPTASFLSLLPSVPNDSSCWIKALWF